MRSFHFPFDAFNPYQSSLARSLQSLGVYSQFAPLRWNLFPHKKRADVFHVHWNSALGGTTLWKFLLGYLFFACQLIFFRFSGLKVVWTVHNLRHHEDRNPVREWLIGFLFSQLADRLIVHGETAASLVNKHFLASKNKIAVIPHGNYIDAYPNRITRTAARQALGLAPYETVFLFLGNIRPYKGLEELINSFSRLEKDDARLILAGRPLSQELEKRIDRLSRNDSRIRFFTGFVENDRIQFFMNAADAVVFPYKNVLTSGAVVLAMSFGKACIAPQMGCIPDIVDSKGAFLYAIDDPNGLYKALEVAASDPHVLNEMGKHNFSKAKDWSWDRVAAATLAVYRGQTPVQFESIPVTRRPDIPKKT